MLVQKLRLKRGWSQQQLADASGLSVRTIQRIEAGHPGNVESLKSLAAVFEIDFQTLSAEPNMNTTTESLSERQEKDAFRHVRSLRRFYVHVVRYVVVVGALFAINLVVSPDRLWAGWVMLGWGIALLFHATRVFRPSSFLGPEWERRQVEKRLGRSL